jgi:hypothetical protein
MLLHDEKTQFCLQITRHGHEAATLSTSMMCSNIKMAYPKADFAMLLPDIELPIALRRLSPIFTRTTGFLAKAS